MADALLEPFGNDLWIAEGPTVPFLTFPYPTRMAVARLGDGSCWLWSPIEWTPALARAIDAIGPVRHLVSPNRIHHLFMGGWAERHPDARMYASPGLARKRPDLRFDAELSAAPDPAWAGQIDQVVFRSPALDEVVFFHRASRTAIVCDLIQRHDPATISGWKGLAMRLDGLVGPDGSTPRELRAMFFRRGAARDALRTALAWDPERLLIAHGACATTGGRAALAHGLRWLGVEV